MEGGGGVKVIHPNVCCKIINSFRPNDLALFKRSHSNMDWIWHGFKMFCSDFAARKNKLGLQVTLTLSYLSYKLQLLTGFIKKVFKFYNPRHNMLRKSVPPFPPPV